MLNGQHFSFTECINILGQTSILPYLPLTLNKDSRSIEVMALLDTGASVNVLPYELGLQREHLTFAKTLRSKLTIEIGRTKL